MQHRADDSEWITLAMILSVYLLWALATTLLWPLSPTLSILATGVLIAQFSSLQHEALHGHPFRNAALNEALVTPALTLTVPFGRFRATHLAHHHDPILTDPYEDPESNFLDPAAWDRTGPVLRAVLTVNNTLLGRMVIGPIHTMVVWLAGEARLILAGDRAVRRDWALHALGLVPVVAWLSYAAMPWWGYLLAAWIGHGLLRIRTFLEHRAHELPRARTVVIEDRGPLSILFLNNNFHVVHHMHPGVAWYRLPSLYSENRAHYLRRNEGYRYGSYLEVFRRHFLRRKDPVPHPIWPFPSDQAAEDGPVAPVVEERHARVATPAE